MPATRHPGVRDAVPVERFLDCIHCGLCTSSCPTYLETGDENQGPRGRIYLMRAVSEGRIELDDAVRTPLETCLDCRACETACPSGVQYGRIIEPFRVAMEESAHIPSKFSADEAKPLAAKNEANDWFRRWILFRLFPYPGRLAWSLFPARLLKRVGLFDFLSRPVAAVAPQRIRRLMELLPQELSREPALPEFLPAIGPRRATVALFRGCAADALFRHVHWATARVLQANGCEVWTPRDQVCCGAIHYHAGSSDPARDLANRNVVAFDKQKPIDAIVVNVAGCGSMLKDYGHHWDDAATPLREAFAAKVRDVQEFLDELGLVEPTGPVELTATYHDACHLAHAQKIREAPRRLLSKIPGLKLVPLPESEVCCGAAGTYNLTQPEMSDRLGRRKRGNIQKTGAEVVVSANAGCTLQITKKLSSTDRPLPVVHPMELLDRSYRAGGAYDGDRANAKSVPGGAEH